MIFLRSIIILCLCITQVLCLPKLVKWNDRDNQPTWHNEFTLGPFDKKPATYQQVLSYAKEYYNQIKSDPKATPKNSEGKSGPLLVAVLYVPGTTAQNHKIYASTVPRDSRKNTMVSDRQKATAWYAQTRTLKSTKQDDVTIPFHAEDAAYFNFETLNPDSKRTRYPLGSTLAVWGRFDGQAEAGTEQKPCGDYPLRDPSCAVVANNLGVTTVNGAPRMVKTARGSLEELMEDMEIV